MSLSELTGPPSMAADLIALDIGGANIKAARSDGGAISVPFALWRAPDRLKHVLRPLLDPLAPNGTILVTTTAELCDCFRTKREGVLHVLDALEQAAWELRIGPDQIRVWVRQGELIPLHVARTRPLDVAAANWLATAFWVGTLCPQGTSLLTDVGSTTTDITVIRDGAPLPLGLSDTDRLLSRELIYVGVRRTPVNAVVSSVPYRQAMCPVMAELFATSLDVFLLTGEIPDRPEDCNTADGRPATREAALARIARTVGGDPESIAPAEAELIARHIRCALIARVEAALASHARRVNTVDRVFAAGEGEFVVQEATRRVLPGVPVETLSERAGPEASRAACAFALLKLWSSRASA